MAAPTGDAATTRAIVRRNWIWAAGAAGVMLYFGIPATGLDAFAPQRHGWMLFVYTLQFGGGAMALSAVLSLTGVPLALLYDAIVSVFIGVALAVSGVLIYAGKPHQAVFNVLFGLVFVHSGYRNFREFGVVASLRLWVSEPEESDQP